MANKIKTGKAPFTLADKRGTKANCFQRNSKDHLTLAVLSTWQ